MKGSLTILGLGPGGAGQRTAEASHALAAASDVVGYSAYLQRVDAGAGQQLHTSDNRQEVDRARHALSLAFDGRQVALVSGGDPGVFAMASTVFEELEKGPQEWLGIKINVLPGVTAMLAAAARLGAPLGHDFCAINLSDNLKPWQIVESRLRTAAMAGFAMALYNPRSRARSGQFDAALGLLRGVCGNQRLIAFARAVGTGDESLKVTTLGLARAEMADMRTLVIVANPQTRRAGNWIYAPRSWESAAE